MENKNLLLLEHPLIKRDITLLRNEKTSPEEFRAVLNRVSRIIAVELSKSLNLMEIEVTTPLEITKGYKLADQIVLAPVLRAGMGMLNGFLEVIPEAKVGHIGLKRDEETLNPIYYYYKTPVQLENAMIIVLDPMLATGGSASEAINYLKENNASNVKLACVVASPEGVKKVSAEHPDVKIFCTALDRELNNKGYILPGLGDAGDRIFGT